MSVVATAAATPEVPADPGVLAFAAAHGKLACYLGEQQFAELLAAFLAQGGGDLVAFLIDTPPWSRNPEVAEFARLELALAAVSGGPRGRHLTHAEFDAIPRAKLDRMAFAVDPRAKRFQFRTNVTSLWSCVACTESPPRPERRREPIDVLVWQQGCGARFRILGREEALALDAAAAGKTYADIKTQVARTADAAFAEERTRGYLRGWIEAELISGLNSPASAKSKT